MGNRTHLFAGRHSVTFEGRHARMYDVLARRLIRGLYRRIAEDAAGLAPEGGAVLDAGTGPGVLPVELATRRPDLRVAAIDMSTDMAAAAARNLSGFGDRAEARQADVAALPFADGTFDLVVASLTAHHWTDPAAATAEIARVLRPGGRFAVYDVASAPYDAIDRAARDLFGEPARHTPFKAGRWPVPKLFRHVLG
ncbi:MAG TPA: class I SAM-dependent methyltransferase [Kribbellaceae bacterium]